MAEAVGTTTEWRADGRHEEDRTAALAPLSLRAVTKCWPGAEPVLDGVNLDLEPGSVVAISGRNGAGKTTLLRIACGLIAPDAGTVRVDGVDPESDSTEFQRRVGFVPAGNTGLYARLRTEHHLELWSRLALMPRATRDAAIKRVAADFDLEPLCGKRVDRLSMGQRQRVRLALGFLHEPSVVMLDEPANSLDEEAVALLADALARLNARGGAAIVCLPSGWQNVLPVDAKMVLSRGRLEPR